MLRCPRIDSISLTWSFLTFSAPTGVAPTTNRTAWPTNGGALSLIPIHPFALMTVNIAIGNSINENQDSNPYSVPMVPLFNQTGANSTFCLPKIKIPKSIAGQVKAGVNATIQVIQLTATNAALYGVRGFRSIFS